MCRQWLGHEHRARITTATSATLLDKGTPERQTEVWMYRSDTQAELAEQVSRLLSRAEPSIHRLMGPSSAGGWAGQAGWAK